MSDTTTDPAPDNAFVPGGPPADEAPGLRDDDFGLNGDLKTQLLSALESRWNADDPGATTLDDPSADTAATPVPAPDTSTEPETSQGQPVQDGGGGGRAADDGSGAAASSPDDATAPPAAPPPADQFDVGAYFNDYFGTPLTREQAAHLAGMIGGLQSLSPEQRAELDRVLAGGQPNQYPATTGMPAQQPAQSQPAAPPADDPAVSVLGPRPDDDYLAAQWDMTARAYRATQEQTAALQADIARQTQLEQQRQMALAQERIDAATNQWREDHKTVLSDAEFDALKARAERSGIFPGLYHAHHGDYTAATNALFEQHFWSDPALRERAIANLASGRAPGDHTQVDATSPAAQAQAQTDAGRQALASSVAGGGGSITPQSSTVPTDPNQRKAAMAAEIAAQHDFTQ